MTTLTGRPGPSTDQFGAGVRPVDSPYQKQGAWTSIYRGIVTKTNDPAMRGRVKVQCPWPFGKLELNWAEPCFPPGQFFVPRPGDPVWIMFENGFANQPIWMGIWYRGGQANGQAVTDELQANDEETNTTAEEDAQHAGMHDHSDSKFYSPHLYSFVTPSGHRITFEDWRGIDAATEKRGYVEIADRDGRIIRLSGQGFIDIAALGERYIRLNEVDGQIEVVVEGGRFIRLDEAGSIDIVVPDGDTVNIGGVSGEEVVTKTHLTAVFNSHTHGTPSGPSGPPLLQAPVAPGTDITKKQKSE